MEINYKGILIVQQELVMICGMVDSSMARKNEIKIRYALKVRQAGLLCKIDVEDRVWRICDGTWNFCLSK